MPTTTLPNFSKTIDNAFTQTWYDIRSDAIDNIMLATRVWSMLKEKGCFKTQVGGSNVERTVRYALPATQNLTKGTVMTNQEVETRTAAFWTWRAVGVNIVRTLLDDQKNQGKYRISSYVSDRLEEAKDALGQNYEAKVLQAQTLDESGIDIQGLNDMIPTFSATPTGTYGGIARPTAVTAPTSTAVAVPTAGNTWWNPIYFQLNAPYEVNLVSDMRHLYNSITLNLEAPDMIVMDQTLNETYEEFGLDTIQIVKNDTMSANLGFNVLRFKEADMIWSPNMTLNNALFLNTKYIDLMYDPTVWFQMTEWKTTPNQLERAAQIVCVMNLISSQLRRHGRLYA